MLLEMRWWDWPLSQIEAALPLLCSGDVKGVHRHWSHPSLSANLTMPGPYKAEPKSLSDPSLT